MRKSISCRKFLRWAADSWQSVSPRYQLPPCKFVGSLLPPILRYGTLNFPSISNSGERSEITRGNEIFDQVIQNAARSPVLVIRRRLLYSARCIVRHMRLLGLPPSLLHFQIVSISVMCDSNRWLTIPPPGISLFFAEKFVLFPGWGRNFMCYSVGWDKNSCAMSVGWEVNSCDIPWAGK